MMRVAASLARSYGNDTYRATTKTISPKAAYSPMRLSCRNRSGVIVTIARYSFFPGAFGASAFFFLSSFTFSNAVAVSSASSLSVSE